MNLAPVRFGAHVEIKGLSAQQRSMVGGIINDELKKVSLQPQDSVYLIGDQNSTHLLNGSEGRMFKAIESSVPKLIGAGLLPPAAFSVANDLVSSLVGRQINLFNH